MGGTYSIEDSPILNYMDDIAKGNQTILEPSNLKFDNQIEQERKEVINQLVIENDSKKRQILKLKLDKLDILKNKYNVILITSDMLRKSFPTEEDRIIAIKVLAKELNVKHTIIEKTNEKPRRTIRHICSKLITKTNSYMEKIVVSKTKEIPGHILRKVKDYDKYIASYVAYKYDEPLLHLYSRTWYCNNLYLEELVGKIPRLGMCIISIGLTIYYYGERLKKYTNTALKFIYNRGLIQVQNTRDIEIFIRHYVTDTLLEITIIQNMLSEINSMLNPIITSYYDIKNTTLTTVEFVDQTHKDIVKAMENNRGGIDAVSSLIKVISHNKDSLQTLEKAANIIGYMTGYERNLEKSTTKLLQDKERIEKEIKALGYSTEYEPSFLPQENVGEDILMLD